MPLLSVDELQRDRQRCLPGLELAARRVGNDDSLVLVGRWAKRTPPGGTLSGPTMMALAETRVVVILAHIGRTILAVTTSLHIDFCANPISPISWRALGCSKLGRRLAVVDVESRARVPVTWCEGAVDVLSPHLAPRPSDDQFPFDPLAFRGV